MEPSAAPAPPTMESVSFQRLAALSAFVVGLGGIGYAAAFVVVLHSSPKSANLVLNLLQVLGGPLTAAVFIALYYRLRETDRAFSLWALLIGVIAAFGSSAHGGYNMANVIKKPPAGVPDISFLPSQADPRGLFTFVFAALAIFVFSWLIVRSGVFPRNLGSAGFVLAALLVAVYMGRLIIYNPKSPGLYALALITGFGAIPIWYSWLGLTLWRSPSSHAGP